MPGGNARLGGHHGGHLVQFYGDDDELSASVGRFLGAGLAEGCPAVVVATPAHRAAFGARLGADAEDSAAVGRLLMVDAGEMLDSFLAGGRIDPVRFQDAASGLIGRAADTGQPVRIYAEMVALLWDAGQVTLALELEALWNDLLSSLSFSLLCGYPARLMTERDEADALEEVCRLHSGVLSPQPRSPGATGISPDGSAAVRHFPRALESARQARRFVLDLLGPRVDQAVAVDAAIVTAELAGNAVVHARLAFTVTVSRSAEGMRISVRDAASLEDCPPMGASPGHGLDVVAQLASKWAVEPLPGGKTVWAELPASPRNPGSPGNR